MLAAIRKNEIKRELLTKKSVTVPEMAEQFQVTEETIRRDLKALEADGIAERTHGGAVLKEKVLSSVDRELLKNIMSDSKLAMAKLAQGHIANGLCVYLDSSTTVQFLVPEILDKRITIVTNSLDIASQCVGKPNINLVQLGGTLDHQRRCYTGRSTCEMLDNHYFDLSVVSCRTLSMDEGLTESDIEESEVKRQAIQRSKRLLVLADHTKFDKVSFVKIVGLDKLNTLVTDRPLSREWRDCLAKNHVELLCTPNQDT